MNVSHQADLHVQRMSILLLKAAWVVAIFRGALKLFESVMKYSNKATRVTYREIRQDLNGKREADGFYKVISCLDSGLPEDIRAKFSEFDSGIPKPSGDLANDQVEAKLCKKYGAKS